MDEMKIVSKFTRRLISKILRHMLIKKTGCDADIQLNDLAVCIDEKAHIHVDIEADISKDDLLMLFRDIDLS
jgi:hypothetical protein